MSQPQRITIKYLNPNPLFIKWVTEWRDKAKERDQRLEHYFTIALEALTKFPIPLESGRDCIILQGFGQKLCRMLDEKLKEHRSLESGLMNKDICLPSSSKTNHLSPAPVGFIPETGSGEYAIIVALYIKSLEPDYGGFLTKQHIIHTGKPFSKLSFVKACDNTKKTAWASMKILLDKDLVIKSGNPAQFSLSEAGKELGKQLYEAEDFQELANKNALEQETKNSEVEESVTFPPDSFDIILYVDTQETIGKDNLSQDPLLSDLSNFKVQFEVKSLHIGDYLWICRHRTSKKELVLPYLFERKRMDDLASSIRDNRYHEQKFRLKRCGIPNITYLIENCGKNDHNLGLPLDNLHQAITNTAIQDDFQVVFTENLRETAAYLDSLSQILINQFKSKTVYSSKEEDLQEFSLGSNNISLMHFKEFNQAAAKSNDLTVSDWFVRALIQIKGMALNKALAIVDQYPTPALLFEAYKNCEDGELLLASIRVPSTGKPIGKILSCTVHQFFTRDSF